MAKTLQERQKDFRERRKANGLCVQCGKPLDRKGSKCKACNEKFAEYTRTTYFEFKDMGVCPRCKKNPIMGDENMCPECRAYRCNVENGRRDKDRDSYNEYMREYRKNKRLELISNGICTTCGKRKADKGYKTCEWCRKRNRQKKKKQNKREMWIYNDCCYFCGKPTVKGLKVCEEHRKILTEQSNSPKCIEERRKYNKEHPFRFGKRERWYQNDSNRKITG